MPTFHDRFLTMKYSILLHNKSRSFSTLSSLQADDVLDSRFNRVILLLHGFPDDNTSFDGIWPLIHRAFPNALILAPLMRGYEPSSQGNARQTRVVDLADDIRAWINEVNADAAKIVPVHVVGHDWGAIAAYRAAADYPNLIDSICVLSIPYLPHMRLHTLLLNAPEQVYNSSYMFTMQFAFLYRKRLSDTSPDSYLNRLWHAWSPGWKFQDHDIASLKATLQRKGVIDAITSYYRNMMNPFNLWQIKWEIKFEQVPTLILGGYDDGCMSRKLFEMDAKTFKDEKNVEVHVLPRVGHFMHREDPETVAGFINDWINGLKE